MMSAVISAVMMMVATTMAAPQLHQNIDLVMPGVKPKAADTYLCISRKMEDAHRYITGFVPKADAHIAHHVLLYGCEEPGAPPGHTWNCGEMSSDSSYKTGQVCNRGSNIIYAWAMEAPQLTLPPDVSFDVGQETAIKYLVLQVHYSNVSKFLPPVNGEDNSGLALVTTTVPTKKQAGVYLMLTGGYIPAHSTEYFEAACSMTEDVEMVPFAFRTHAHSLGRVISGYRIRDGQWTEIGRKDPRLPEMFYNTTTPGVTVRKGDIMAARCTMENNLDHDVGIGATKADEMCNFYVMYYVDRPPILDNHVCMSRGPPFWYWADFSDQRQMHLEAVPDTASVIPGTQQPLIRNAVYPESENTVPGMPGRFEDIDSESDAIIDQAIQEMDGDELLALVQQLTEEQEQEEAERLWLEQQYMQQQMAPQEQRQYMRQQIPPRFRMGGPRR